MSTLWKSLCVVALAMSLCGFGAARLIAQTQQDQDRDQDRIQNQDRDRDQNRDYQRGDQDRNRAGDQDQDRDRVQDRDHDRMQDRDQNRDRDQDREHDQGYYNRDRDERGQNWNQNPAYRLGFQDGLNDGRADRDRGRTSDFRKRENYKKGDHGYSSQFGDRNRYRQEYREAYERGYQQGLSGQVSNH